MLPRDRRIYFTAFSYHTRKRPESPYFYFFTIINTLDDIIKKVVDYIVYFPFLDPTLLDKLGNYLLFCQENLGNTSKINW